MCSGKKASTPEKAFNPWRTTLTTVTLQGNPFNVDGSLPAIGSAAPALTLTNGELAGVTLANYAGKRKVI